MSLSQELLDLATRHQVYLERLKAGEIKRTDVLFNDLDRRLLDALGKVADADLGILTDLEAAALLEDIRKGQVEAYTEHLNKLVRVCADLAVFSREYELESIDHVTLDGLEPDDGGGIGLWAWVQQRPMTATGKLLSSWLAAWMGNEVTRSGDLVRRARAEGWSVSQLRTAFRGTKAQGYTDGLFGSAKRNTATTINTALQHVSTAARARTIEKTILKPKGPVGQRLKVDPDGTVTSIPRRSVKAAALLGIKVGTKIAILGYRWVSILDNRTSQLCRSLDGQVFEHNKGPLPPAHANCRSSIIAEILGRWLKRDESGRFTGRPPRKAAGAKGEEVVAGSTSYYEWLKTQPSDFQDDALGKTRAELFRKGGLSATTFARLNLSKTFQPLTLDEMRKLKPNAFKRAGL